MTTGILTDMSTRAARGYLRLILIAAAALLAAGTALADHEHEHEHERLAPHQHFDAHFNHNHAYFERGYVVHSLPRERIEVVRPGGAHFFFHAGVWYAPRGPGFVVVAAPLGVFIPVLPAFYTTVWVGGLPYYYANDTYYVYRGPAQGYEVVAAPDESQVSTQSPESAPPPPAGNQQVFTYPKNGQSDEQQAKDRYECHRWAVTQSSYDPTAAGGGVAPGDAAARRADYQRAMTACLEGRGYSVK